MNETSIKIDKTYNNDDVFIYGSKVDDFHTLDKSYIYTLNVCTTQELYMYIKCMRYTRTIHNHSETRRNNR